jgi:uncharacterized coiled-coil protein SlyX
MTKLADASINSFGSSPKADVPPEESIFVLTSSQIHAIISKAIQPLQDDVMALKATVSSQRDEMAALYSKLASLESTQEQDVTRVFLSIAEDRRRLSALENPVKDPGRTELVRAEKIEKYLVSRPDHRATFETLKGHLGIDNDLLGIAIRSLMPSGKYAIVKTPGDKRKRTLVMLQR